MNIIFSSKFSQAVLDHYQILLILIVALIVYGFKKNYIWPQIFWVVITCQLLLTGNNVFSLVMRMRNSFFTKELVNFQKPYLPGQIFTMVQPLLAGWIAAGIIGLLGYYFFIRRGHEQLFDRRDLWLVVIGCAIVGWPAIFVFLASIFVCSVLVMLFLVIIRKKSMTDRLVVTPCILPAAIITILIGPFVLPLTHLDVIRF